MFRLIGDRCTGKTRQLMQYAKDNNAVFVCSNPYSMMQKAESYGIVGLRFMSYSEFLTHKIFATSERVAIYELGEI